MSAAPENLRVLQGGRMGDVPPASQDAEEGLIATVLLDESGASLAIARQIGLVAAAFYWPVNQVIWSVLLELQERGEKTDLLTLRAELDARQRLEDVGGDAFLVSVSKREATTAHTRYLAETVKLLWERRYAIRQARELAEKCAAGQQSREEFVAAAGELGQRLIRLGRRELLRSLEEIIDGVVADVGKRFAGDVDKSGWIYTRLPHFDEKCKPLGSQREDNMIIVAGASGDGKSALMRAWGGEALRQNQRVKVYTRETSIDGFVEQLAATWAAFDLNEAEMQPRDRLEKFNAGCEELKKYARDRRLWVVQQDAATPLTTIEDLAEDARAHVNLYGPIGEWIVDYAQLFGTRRRFNNREQEMAYVSHTLQALVRELGGVWLIGCQFNEAGLVEMRTPKHDDKGRLIHRLPQRGDLRESQAFFHDSDRTLGLYRPPEDCRGQEQTSSNILNPEMWIVQMKRRRGGEGFVRCWFQKRFTRFVELGELDASERQTAPDQKAYLAKKQPRPSPPAVEKPEQF